MKIPILLACLLASTLCGIGPGPSQPLGLAATETYVRLYPQDGFLHVKEYRLVADSPETVVEPAKAMVKAAGYSAERFRFVHFTAIEESMKHDEDRITGEYHLLTKETDPAKLLEDGFGRILNRKVTVKIDSTVALYYNGPDVAVGSHNAEGIYQKGDQRMLVWKKNLKYYEAVFRSTAKSGAPSIAASFGADVSSPIKTEAEIAAWKNPAANPSANAEAAYQHDADIFRLRHLKYYGELISEFHRKTGRYPLQGKSKHPNYVYLATPQQQKSVKGGPPLKYDVTNVENFRRELEKGLGRKIDLKFDPQKIPVTAPNFYIYMIDGDTYFLAVHLYHERPFAAPVSAHYHKAEITNRTPARRGLSPFELLLGDDAFKQALAEPPLKNGWFEQLEQQNR